VALSGQDVHIVDLFHAYEFPRRPHCATAFDWVELSDKFFSPLRLLRLNFSKGNE
jgi:hypothetical protein